MKFKIAFMLILIAFVGCTNKEDEKYWVNNRDQLKILSSQIRTIQSDTRLRFFSKDTADVKPVDNTGLALVERDYPQYKKKVIDIIATIKTLNIIECLSGQGYVAFIIKSGGLASDTILVNDYDATGLNEYKKDIKPYGFDIHTIKVLEPHWTYTYTD
jgi:hypothetical protein